MSETGQPRQRGRRRWWWIGATILLVAASSATTWWFTTTSEQAVASTPQSVTRMVAASVQTLKRTVSTTGNLTPAIQQDVAFGAGGRVTSVRVAAGDTVRKGQVLGTIDTVALKADLASAKLTLAQAQARVAADENAVDAAAETDQTTDDTTAAAQLAADQATVATATQGVTDAQQSLAAATLVAPVDGLVAQVNVSVGDTVSSSSSAAGSSGNSATGRAGGTGSSASAASSGTSSSAQFLIVGTGSWKVQVNVDDSQINLIKKGLQAQLTVGGVTGTVFGRVTSVGLISTATGDTASYPVEVAVTGSPKGLHDGAVATIEIIYQQLTDVLAVPSSAVHTENGASVVHRTVDGAQQSTPVQVGDTIGGYTVITAGLSEGDEVAVTASVGGGQGTGLGRTGTSGQGGGRFPGGAGFPTGGQFPGGAGAGQGGGR